MAAPERDPLQRLLAMEHSAVHLFALLGAQTSQSADPTLYAGVRAAYNLHRARRDLLSSWISDDGGEPVAAAPAYDDPAPFGSADQIAREAARAEQQMCDGYATVVANTVGRRRRWAADALTDAAVRAVTLGDSPAALPGWQ